MTTGISPTGRTGHTATAVGNKLIIYGGMARTTKAAAEVFDDAFVLNTDTFEWSQLSTAFEPPNPPGRRLDHDICVVSSESDEVTLMLFGGMDFQHMYNDMFELKLAL
ncbi:hypothetical protein HK097_003770 [Rhizophlyctis rosea]|uniref:Uncharacterized protein n=1 Tax=Rhizophlyctis rosea TaxID=64517 RepID=A0AAD5S405_9FUNG|nr:hypothetical protein HK097_003770 [Rhizophlyctis rosea]